ncbi:hypothetical protein NC653_026563 [Populus alba x Populus x berolinensis]|uniref:Uncharacterized protein n=1 Tax=Populus alba x Populus x berolinensis TaxID=444605 RepID=A0AAD6Q931_9ROSI|nr:hypothetical protein NC653_026563 [Populus alba x Populus x berolinensis]
MSPDMSSAATLFLPCFVSDWLITVALVPALAPNTCASAIASMEPNSINQTL